MVVVDIIDKKLGIHINYYMEPRLKKNFDEKIIPSLLQKDKDCVLAVDGNEGSGKSTLALQIGKYCDPTLDLNRIVFNADDFRKEIYRAKKGQCVIFDEAFTGLSSRSALSAVNRTLISLMMQIRQKNLIVIFVLPTFYLLDKYIALFRTKALIHVYENKGKRGFFKVYNRNLKRLLYLKGAKTMSYRIKGVFSKFRGQFRGKFALGSEELEKLYRKKKMKALEETEKTPMTAVQVKYKNQRDIMIYILRKELILSYREIERKMADYGFEINAVEISKICKKKGDKLDKDDKRFKEEQELLKQSEEIDEI